MFRPEYPRPQMVRPDWINLNGKWEYRTDKMASGTDRRWFEPDVEYPEVIEVPFCRESELSGIGDKDFCDCVWYRKQLTLPESWTGKRLLLHIGACDYRTTVWVDGKEVGSHLGGYVSFTMDLTQYLTSTTPVLIIRAEDDVRTCHQPGGKQSRLYHSHGCDYTRTTGIWQTVWLEAVEQTYIKSTKYYPDIDAGTLTVLATVESGDGMTLEASASYAGKPMGCALATVHGNQAMLTLKLDELHLWEVGNGRLYDLELTLGADRVTSYFGMRNIGIRDGVFSLNGKVVFQRLVLDQGFYPDGIYTAPTEQALIDDITRSIDMGFNGARLHQKVFEERFLYHCDRLGYLVWGEEGNWGLDIKAPEAWKGMLPEWVEVMERDFNHPAIIGWCPLNETQIDQDPDFVRFVASVTRAVDPTRLFIDASGWRHVDPAITDMIDLHDYTQDPAAFAAMLEPLKEGKPIPIHLPRRWGLEEITTPTFVSEYGGIYWNPADESIGYNSDSPANWGYGVSPRTPEEFISRFKGLAEAILFHPKMAALCYTQLTDVEQERNGLYTYDRQPKFDPALFRAVLTQVAAIEQENN